MFQALFVFALIIGVVSMVKWYNSGVSKYGKEVVDKAIAKFHVGSFVFLGLLWAGFTFSLVTTQAEWYTVDTQLELYKTIAGYIVGTAFISTIIIVVMLHRLHNTLASIDEHLKEIKDIEQKISERPPVIIQKKEPFDK